MQAGLRCIRSFKSPHSLRHWSSSCLTQWPTARSLHKPLSASFKSTLSRQEVLFKSLILIKFVKIFSANLLCVLEVLSLLEIWPEFTLEMAQSQRTLGTLFIELAGNSFFTCLLLYKILICKTIRGCIFIKTRIKLYYKYKTETRSSKAQHLL